MERIAIAIDGPAGAGKSTIARIIADRLKILYIDTGAMYRAITLYMIKNNIELNELERIKGLLDKIYLEFKDNRIFVDGVDVSDEIRDPEVNKYVSPVSTIPIVREKLVDLQRSMALKNSVVMDGRDIGTNVLKDADIKIFLTASVNERAKRRYLEMLNKSINVDMESVKRDISLRDKIDSEREINPLRKAPDAIAVDTTGKSIEDVVNEIIYIIKKR
jgi:cytidylate kinase